MKNKKILMLIVLTLFMFLSCFNSVLADCGDCSITNCEECGCTLNSSGTTCIYNNYIEGYKSCGSGMLENIPSGIPKVTSIIYTIFQIAIPVVLVIIASIDLVKSLYAQKEDDIKKSMQTVVKRLIVAALVFFVFVIVKLLISVVADNNSSDIIDCAECFIENKCD